MEPSGIATGVMPERAVERSSRRHAKHGHGEWRMGDILSMSRHHIHEYDMLQYLFVLS
jgi:hypothetical protein